VPQLRLVPGQQFVKGDIVSITFVFNCYAEDERWVLGAKDMGFLLQATDDSKLLAVQILRAAPAKAGVVLCVATRTITEAASKTEFLVDDQVRVVVGGHGDKVRACRCCRVGALRSDWGNNNT
jgi:hypothetical protein